MNSRSDSSLEVFLRLVCPAARPSPNPHPEGEGFRDRGFFQQPARPFSPRAIWKYYSLVMNASITKSRLAIPLLSISILFFAGSALAQNPTMTSGYLDS